MKKFQVWLWRFAVMGPVLASFGLGGCYRGLDAGVSPQTAPAAYTPTPPVYQTQFGSQGSGNGQMYKVRGIACDSQGNIYVADNGNYRVEKFGPNGNYLAQWGSYGSGNGQFLNSEGMCVDSSDNIYVSDKGTGLVQKFNTTGGLLAHWACGSSPNGVAADGSGDICVAEAAGQAVQKYTDTGTLIASWSTQGSWDNLASNPDGIACDSSGNVYTPDYDNYCVFKYSNTGTYLETIGYGQCGVLSCGLFADKHNCLLVADYTGMRIDEFKTDGTFLFYWGNTGSNPLGSIDYLCQSPSGKIYVVDHDVIKVFGP